MSAENLTGYGSGGKRVKLVEQLPLASPFGIVIMPIYACNFRCNYCMYSIPKEKHGLHYATNIMSYDMLKKLVDDINEFDQKIKVIRFAGCGEPLLHPDIDKMIAYISQSGVTDQIEILTNGALLTPDMSDRLIKSGLTNIRISLQGLCPEDYKETSNVEIDFNKFVSNIKYLYEHKKNLKLGVKIMSIHVDTDEKRNKLWEIFGNISDFISVEELSPIVSKVNYDRYGFTDENPEGGGKIVSMRGFDIPHSVHICHYPFFLIMINPDGTVLPCCALETPPRMGCITDVSLKDIWHGEVFNSFRKAMLTGVENCGDTCKNCKSYMYNMFEEDVITDDDAKRLTLKY